MDPDSLSLLAVTGPPCPSVGWSPQSACLAGRVASSHGPAQGMLGNGRWFLAELGAGGVSRAWGGSSPEAWGRPWEAMGGWSAEGTAASSSPPAAQRGRALPLLSCVACGGQGPSLSLISLSVKWGYVSTLLTVELVGGMLARAPWTPLLSPPQLSSPMNPVSSSEDIKPPLGLNGVLKVPAHPSGNMASFTKHICAICGDRSSGRPPRGCGTPAGRGQGCGEVGGWPGQGGGLSRWTSWCVEEGTGRRAHGASPQASTTGCTAARAARASSSGRCART